MTGFLKLAQVGGGGGRGEGRPLFGPDIRLLTITLKRFYLAPPNLVTFSFYLLDRNWKNLSKIDSPGGLLQLFLEILHLETCRTYDFSVFLENHRNAGGGGKNL